MIMDFLRDGHTYVSFYIYLSLYVLVALNSIFKDFQKPFYETKSNQRV